MLKFGINKGIAECAPLLADR